MKEENKSADTRPQPTRQFPLSSPDERKILWSSISRNGTILVESGDDPFHGAVVKTAGGILAKANTPGWEFYTLKRRNFSHPRPRRRRRRRVRLFQRKAPCRIRTTITTSDGEEENQVVPFPKTPKLKAIKFHVFERNERRDDSELGDSIFNHPIVWVFAAVYNPEATTWKNEPYSKKESQVQHFLQELVFLTAVVRLDQKMWRKGPPLACQASFSSVLGQRMEELTYQSVESATQKSIHKDEDDDDTISVNSSRTWIQSNIAVVLENEEQRMSQSQHRLHGNDDRSTNNSHNADGDTNRQSSIWGMESWGNAMSASFQKNIKAIRRRVMMQKAKRGMVAGTTISVVVGVCVVPPLMSVVL